MSGSFRRSLIALGPNLLAQFQLHHRLGEHPYPCFQDVHVPFHLGLAQELHQCHPALVGHPVQSPLDDFRNLDEDHGVAAPVNPPPFLHH
jgi:hypothetical protein